MIDFGSFILELVQRFRHLTGWYLWHMRFWTENHSHPEYMSEWIKADKHWRWRTWRKWEEDDRS